MPQASPTRTRYSLAQVLFSFVPVAAYCSLFSYWNAFRFRRTALLDWPSWHHVIPFLVCWVLLLLVCRHCRVAELVHVAPVVVTFGCTISLVAIPAGARLYLLAMIIGAALSGPIALTASLNGRSPRLARIGGKVIVRVLAALVLVGVVYLVAMFGIIGGFRAGDFWFVGLLIGLFVALHDEPGELGSVPCARISRGAAWAMLLAPAIWLVDALAIPGLTALPWFAGFIGAAVFVLIYVLAFRKSDLATQRAKLPTQSSDSSIPGYQTDFGDVYQRIRPNTFLASDSLASSGEGATE